jgi:phosphoribosylanthranilate isomerase
MSRTRIKFCGLTREEDVRAALACGVEALGFNLATGPRRITPARAAELTALVPPPVARVALFVDADEAGIVEALRISRCNVVQLHGDEPPALAEALRARGLTVIKAFRIRDAASLATAAGYPCDLLLLDAWVAGVAGGSGASWDWSLLRDWACARPFMLAGGLRPDNVGAAVAALRPFAVDTSSGIETVPAIKDAAAMRAFVAAVEENDHAH